MQKIHYLKKYSVDVLQSIRPNDANRLTSLESASMSKIIVTRRMNVANSAGQAEQFEKTGEPLTIGTDIDIDTYRRLLRAGAAEPYVEPQGVPGAVGPKGERGNRDTPLDKMTKAQLEAEAKLLEIDVPAGSDKAAVLALIKAHEAA